MFKYLKSVFAYTTKHNKKYLLNWHYFKRYVLYSS